MVTAVGKGRNVVVVTKKYQITIPEEVRKGPGTKPGDKIVFIKTGKGYLLMKVEDLLDEMCRVTEDIEEVSEAVRESFKRAIEELEKQEDS
ncbi:AbrB/MazE/SpoVT family DNA-binding domain-containing protein [Thermococcus sp. LS2]|uniref:AbrB/MazE/SpoVT family DNA-binding domain-containing protein n=1 Tax=Thermococcus sp. LS2 TaxID=1638260 RepID=UPI00143AA834|nr:AbrB/MazE/SpoVT family DNA-binding domain-containing protein [Thermococcus sp. LS2]NJE13756.1 AbrB family transcriptional regulator [Thermococcus sp. LS2]